MNQVIQHGSMVERSRATTSDGESAASGGTRRVYAAIVGTGFSGLGMAIRLKQRGEDDFVVLERAGEVGGTWRDNTYPGCACDIPSHLYSFSFALNPNWSRAYPPQREIWQYLRDCAERFGIVPHIRWNTELLDATWDEAGACWHLRTSGGPYTCAVLIVSNGPLSEPRLPAIPGIERFEGAVFHTAAWNHDADLTGKRVAVIGTGASAIQVVPQIQPKVGQLFLFQRTPPWIVPRLDHPIPTWQRRLYRILPFAQLLPRARIFLRHEIFALGLVYRPSMVKSGERMALRYLARQVPDPALRARLTPHYTIGCKRVLNSDDFYPAVCQPNVELVTDAIREIQGDRVVTGDGMERVVDALICATGFHVTDTDFARRLHGRGGVSLAERWADGPRAYLGTTIAGFPNLFVMIGPNTGLGHNSMVYMIESQIQYILDCLRAMRRCDLCAVEVRAEVQAAFNAEMQRRMHGTVWTSGCASWYLDAGGRNSTLWPGFTFEFRHRTRHFDPQAYDVVPTPDAASMTARASAGGDDA
jgi:cation diffusion facilitator CzcD-associated flavoprotein CzcO